jgi:hydrogenase maturation protease
VVTPQPDWKMENAPDKRGPVLVIGYGNTLRGDDGAGQRTAGIIAASAIAGEVRVISCHQLFPELAADIAASRAVIFIDAVQADESGAVAVREIRPAENSDRIFGHSYEPSSLLALAGFAFCKTPDAWCVTVPGVCFGLSEELSPLATRGVEEAAARVRKICATL